MSDNELGAFLRRCRETVTPAEVGLPEGRRRRTPGLRRSELATLAGVSVEYLTRLEQGRDRRPSPAVLGALADALRLPVEERLHLRIMSKAGDGTLCGAPPAESVRPTVLTLLGRLEPTPAILVNRLFDVLAWTDGYERLAGPAGLLDGRPPNLVRFTFTDARAKAAYPDWERVADERAAGLRAGSAEGDPHLAHLVDELVVTAGAPFAERAKAGARLPRSAGVERFVHPEVGELRLAFETLGLPISDDQRLIAYLPADDAASAGLDALRPGGLRSGGLRVAPDLSASSPRTR
ncbi:helix-turn-helix domain-containing protein [Actinomadura rubrisoli]|uniref:XRE family transcriptional regulator n=1 Tax=Actinomadura rubrisoli TaxID=2530368 RepID=A0A4R5AM11_9ACTN|nr:helix-turn-helix transcriptional regulator [Actinomadura rubrisoli]TDD73663.1 XRE family transcriptional regulator [Actinomadura rubrisoli]